MIARNGKTVFLIQANSSIDKRETYSRWELFYSHLGKFMFEFYFDCKLMKYMKNIVGW